MSAERTIVVVVGGTIQEHEYAAARLVIDITGTLPDHATFRTAEVWSLPGGPGAIRILREDGLAIVAAGRGVPMRRVVSDIDEMLSDPAILVVLPNGHPQREVAKLAERMTKQGHTVCFLTVHNADDRAYVRCERGPDGEPYFVVEHL